MINFSGGTEVGGSFLAPYPVEPIGSCSLAGRRWVWTSTSSTTTVARCAGRSGELVCRHPWPSMTRGGVKDDQRYLDAYWSRFPGCGPTEISPWSTTTASGFILGRSDDVMNVAGKRLAPAEVEAALRRIPR